MDTNKSTNIYQISTKVNGNFNFIWFCFSRAFLIAFRTCNRNVVAVEFSFVHFIFFVLILLFYDFAELYPKFKTDETSVATVSSKEAEMSKRQNGANAEQTGGESGGGGHVSVDHPTS